MNPSRPSVSVVIPVYNGSKTLARALHSVSSQTLRPEEVVVVDDGSSDGSDEVARVWASSVGVPLLLIRNGQNVGIVRSLRRGVDACRGDWVARLDADDEWMPDHLSALVSCAIRDSKLVIVAGRAKLVDSDGNAIGVSRGRGRAGYLRLRMCWDNPFVHSGVMFRCSTYFKVGGYRAVRWEDYDLWVRMMKIGAAEILSDITLIYKRSGQGISAIAKAAALRERAKMQLLSVALCRWYELPVACILAIAGLIRSRLS